MIHVKGKGFLFVFDPEQNSYFAIRKSIMKKFVKSRETTVEEWQIPFVMCEAANVFNACQPEGRC